MMLFRTKQRITGNMKPGNKLSFGDFQKYLDLTYPDLNVDFYRDILLQIKVIYM